jgi:hypothetical protein
MNFYLSLNSGIVLYTKYFYEPEYFYDSNEENVGKGSEL